MGLELDNLNRADVISKKEYMSAKMILRHEHEIEVQKENKKS